MIYLDNAATTPLSPHVKEYIISILDNFYNPSSLYQNGVNVKNIIENTRSKVADFIHADKRDIIFTSGGSASNSLAICGYMGNHNYTMLYSPIAHKSILKCAESFRDAYPLKVNKYGEIDFNDLKEWLNTRSDKFFVVMDYANSEIGTVQNIKRLIDLIHFYNGVVYLDCTGSISQIELDVKSLDVDMAGFSAHKIGALKGTGVLYKKQNIALKPLIYGTQEYGLFSGTENVIGIASLGKAVESYDYSSVSSYNRDYVYNYISKNIPNSYLIGAQFKSRLPHNLYICFKGIDAESLMILLDMNGIQVGTGSACNNRSLTVSATLTEIGIDKDDIHSCVRLTFSGKESQKELDIICKTLSKCIKSIRETNY